ncbi:MAG: hypothetical protein H6622_01360 [Halobacteriovoraceae bacterium]|nr:hypothetical protein [Halobacteriovoraceae bacterium]
MQIIWKQRLITILIFFSSSILANEYCRQVQEDIKKVTVGIYELAKEAHGVYINCLFDGKNEESFDHLISKFIDYGRNYANVQSHYLNYKENLEKDCFPVKNPQLIGRIIDNYLAMRYKIGILSVACTTKGENIFNSIKNPIERQKLFLKYLHEKALGINKVEYEKFLKVYFDTEKWIKSLPETRQ